MNIIQLSPDDYQLYYFNTKKLDLILNDIKVYILK